MPGLSCSSPAPLLWHVGSLVVACLLLVEACMWDLVPWPGIEPGPPALGAQSLNHCAPRDLVVVDLHCCVNFCCTAKWISYTYTYIHSFLDSHIGHYRVLSRVPVLYSRSLLVFYFITTCSYFYLELNTIFLFTSLFIQIVFYGVFVYICVYTPAGSLKVGGVICLCTLLFKR